MISIKIFILSIAGISALNTCDRSILPELTFRLSGNSLEWPCQATKNIYTSTGRYTPKHVIPTRAQIFRNEVIVAMPRYKSGVPFTLGKLSLRRGGCVSSITPFPCWSMQEEGNCEALQSVVDLFLDPQGIIWVLDPGLVNTLEQPVKRCNPKVIAMDARTGRVVKNIDLSPIVTSHSRLQYLVVDYTQSGKAFVYIADAGSRAILVYDVEANKFHRVILPGAVSAECEGSDVLYMALIRKTCGKTVLYFTYLNSSRLFSIKTEHLRLGRGSGAVVDVGSKPLGLKIVLLGTDNGCSLFLRYKGQSDIYLWNTNTCFKSGNFLEVQTGGECRLSTHVSILLYYAFIEFIFNSFLLGYSWI